MTMQNDRWSVTKFGIGQPVLRTEDPVLVRGEGRFTDDVSVAGQAYAVIVRSRHAHGIIRRSTPTPPRKMQGVLGVYTGADLAPPLRHAQMHRAVQEPRRLRDEEAAAPRARRPTRCALSAIRSPSWWRRRSMQAKDAAEAVEVDIEPLPAVTDPERGRARRRAAAL